MSNAQSHLPGRLLTNKEVAQILGVSTRYLWTLRTTGRLPFLKIGNRIRYRAEDVRRWAAEQVQNT